MSVSIDETGAQVWTRQRLISVAGSLVVIGALAFLSYRVGESSSRSPNPSSKPATAVPVTAPAVTVSAPAPALLNLTPNVSAVSLRSARGSNFKLGDFSGKVMLINIWATWCGPCRLETPELIKVHQEFQPRGVEMVGLSTEDPATSAEAVRKFIQDFKVDYRIGWAPGEVAAPLMQGRNSIPQSFIVSRDGRILNHFIGFSPATTPTQIRQALEEALK